jgi:hypothetical protein
MKKEQKDIQKELRPVLRWYRTSSSLGIGKNFYDKSQARRAKTRQKKENY